MLWNFSVDGQQYDPVDEETLLSYLKSGQIPLETMVWQEGMPEWVQANIVFAMQLNTAPAPAPASARAKAQARKGSRSGPQKRQAWPVVIGVLVLLVAIGYLLAGAIGLFSGGSTMRVACSDLVRRGALGRQQMDAFLSGISGRMMIGGVLAIVTGILGLVSSVSLFRKQYSSGNLIIFFSSVWIAYLVIELFLSISVSNELAAAIKSSSGYSIDTNAAIAKKVVARMIFLSAPAFFILWFSRRKVRSYMDEHFESPEIWQ